MVDANLIHLHQLTQFLNTHSTTPPSVQAQTAGVHSYAGQNNGVGVTAHQALETKPAQGHS
jgi:hypothetical protein